MVRRFDASHIDGWLAAVMALRGVGFAWAGFESARYWVELRRRRRFGLADPLIVNRFLLTAVACGAICLALGVPGGAQAAGIDALRSPPIALVFMLFSVTTSASLWFAWAPPKAYRRFIESW